MSEFEYKEDTYKLRWHHGLGSSIALVLVFALVFNFGFPSKYPKADAASFNFVQTDWSGGVEANTTSTHSSDRSGWTKFSSASSSIATSTALTITTSSASGSWTQTSWEDGTSGGTTVTGFSASSNITTSSGAFTLTATGTTDTSLDFDEADAGNFTLESSTSTWFASSGVVALKPTTYTTSSNLFASYTASGQYSGSWPASTAFDNALSGVNGWIGTNGQTVGQWVQIQYASPRTIGRVSFRTNCNGGGNHAAETILLEGSNDASIYTELLVATTTKLDGAVAIQVDAATGLDYFIFSNVIPYSYYKFTIQSMHSGQQNYTGFCEIDMGDSHFPTEGYYVHTTDSSQIDTTGWSSVASTTITENASLTDRTRYLYSFDDRSTWKAWDSGSWETVTLTNIHTSGMFHATASALTAAEWNTPGGFTGSSTLDVAIGLDTTSTSTSPSVSQITFEALKDGSVTSNIFDTGASNIAWGVVSTSYSGDGGIALKIRTSNNSDMSGATAFASCGLIGEYEDITNNGCVTDNHRYVQYELTLAPGWDLGTSTGVAAYDNKSFDLTSEDTNPTSIAFKPDGTKMYIMGLANDTCYQYTLSRPWEVSTSSVSYASKSFSVNSEERTPNGFAMKPDGTKMYVTGAVSDGVFQYTLSTPWDISTASYDNASTSVFSNSQNPNDVSFRPDGTRMYIINDLQDQVDQYALSTAWDITTALYGGITIDVSTEESNTKGFAFKSDGRKLFVIGITGDEVEQYSLSNPWVVSSATYDKI